MQRILVLFILFATVLLGQNPGSGRRIWQTGVGPGPTIAVPNVGRGPFINRNAGTGFNNGFYGPYNNNGFFGVIPPSPTNICPVGYPAGTGAVSIKFDLDQLPKDFQKLVQRGIIAIDGYEQAPVDRYDAFFNAGIQVGGCMDHDILITLEDRRVYHTHINVGFRGTRILYPRFKEPTLPEPPPARPALAERPRDANGEPKVPPEQ